MKLFSLPIFLLAFASFRCNSNHHTIASAPDQSISNVIALTEKNICFDAVCNGWNELPLNLLLDEQQSSMPQTIYHLPYNDRLKHVSCIIDLGDSCLIENLQLFDCNGNENISLPISVGTPDNWQILNSCQLNAGNEWKSISIQKRIRFIRIIIPDANCKLAELRVLGNKPTTKDKPSQILPKDLPLMKDFIGVNGGLWEPTNVLSCCGAFREYHSWFWNDGGQDHSRGYFPLSNAMFYPNNSYAFQPDFDSRHTDDDYDKIIQAGCDLTPCVQLSSLNYVNGGDPNVKPLQPGDNPIAPNSYTAHADYLYQFAARYGEMTHPDSDLKLSKKLLGNPPTSQSRVSGTHRIKYIENWNEPDKWWVDVNKQGKEVQFSPFEMAAMCSADFDGDENRMGNKVGIKNADPNSKLVMGGLAALNLDYIKSMKVWSDAHRTITKKFPADVLNFHHYSTNGSGLFYRDATEGISPEADKLKDKLEEIVAYRDAELPGLEIWLTEFGYDTDPQSPRKAPAIGSCDAYETQARWMLRSYLAMAAARIDRAYWYMMEDVVSEGDNSRWQYNTCGLVKDAGYPASDHPHATYEKKTSWYYLNGFRKILANARFKTQIPQADSNLFIYEFSENPNQSILVIWYGTSDNRIQINQKIALADFNHASLYHLQKNENEPISSAQILTINNSSITIPQISEMPVFIRLERR